MEDDAELARVVSDYLAELERERAYTNDLATDLDAVTALLSEALTLIQRQTARLERQADQIRRLMGLVETGAGWHPPIALVDVTDIEIPEPMTRASEIRWHERPTR